MGKSEEIRIIRNLSYLHKKGDRARLWCNTVLIDQPSDLDLEPSGSEGQVRGFNYNDLAPTFTLFYGKNEQVRFSQDNSGPHGILSIGRDTYRVAARQKTEKDRIIFEARKITDYQEIWNYLASLSE